MRIELKGVVKRFGTTAALKGVDLELLPGEIHALLGENGAGKSTLMHILSGSTRADEGEIRVDGRPVRIDSPRAARRHDIAMVHQHFALVPAFTVADNLALDAQSNEGAAARIVARLHYSTRRDSQPGLERAASLGWTLDPGARVADLPVGTQQRVEIVKTLAAGARTLIFDEPTAVLAGSEVDELFAVLRRLRSENCTVVLIAHKLAEILAVADRVTVLRRGERVASAARVDVDARKLGAWMMGVILPTDVGRSVPPESPPLRVSGSGAPPPGSEPEVLVSSLPGYGAPVFTAVEASVLGDRGEHSIRSVSLELHRGEIFGIGGVDGNGQTELAEALVGIRPLHSGRLEWNGTSFAPAVEPTTGYIPPDRRKSGLALTMSVQENLVLDAVRERQYRRGPFLRARALRNLASGLIAQFDIRVPGLSYLVSSLSGGNQQKIVVARALRSRPEWIVAVNPTRGLDIGATRFVRDQLRQARRDGAAVVLISTDLDEINELSDRAGILSSGSLLEYHMKDGPVEELGMLLGGLPGDVEP